MDFHPDAIIMVTDGYAAPIAPKESDRWIWLITEGGSDDWIREQPTNVRIKSHHISTAEAAAETG